MAAGSILPGSALISGFGLQKKRVDDNRRLYFVFEHPEGSALVELNPDAETTVRHLALQINAALQHPTVRRGTKTASSPSCRPRAARPQIKNLNRRALRPPLKMSCRDLSVSELCARPAY